MISQQNVSANTPMGANLVPGGGATFRVWAPRATEVYLNGVFGGVARSGQTDDLLLSKDANGYWSGLLNSAGDGDLYHFWVNGPEGGTKGFKRDPYARELAHDKPFPNCSCIIRAGDAYPWHDASFVTPDFSNMIVYQLHIGVYAITKPGVASTFLDVIGKIPYLTSLGVNVIQPLPVDEVETDPSMGYDGADYFSPDFPYVVTNPGELNTPLGTINSLLAAKGLPPMHVADIQSGHAQLQALVDLCHVYGLAVVFDVVYNHAGGFNGDDESIFYYDRLPNKGNPNDSLYCTDQDRGTGGLSLALWNNDVRQFLINNALYYINEFHADGFRYDEISSLLSMNKDSGWTFCRDLTGTLRFVKPRLLQNAEFWPGEFGDFPKSRQDIVASVGNGGAGFDAMQHDGLRGAVREAVQSASFGQNSGVNISAIADNLFPAGLPHAWQAVTCIENHDVVKTGRDPRTPVLADGSNPRSWYASSRSRFAMGMLLTAPGIPQLFMGQEFLEDKPWDVLPNPPNLPEWDRLESHESSATQFLQFTKDLIQLRWNHPALRGENVRPFIKRNDDRVIAFHRWLDSGDDVIIVGTLAEKTWFNYAIGFPAAGHWKEVFNSDAYGSSPVSGNAGGVLAGGPPMDGFGASASIVIPANGFVVFARG
jgi:1,4-alpha-glucan branching enzyme